MVEPSRDDSPAKWPPLSLSDINRQFRNFRMEKRIPLFLPLLQDYFIASCVSFESVLLDTLEEQETFRCSDISA